MNSPEIKLDIEAIDKDVWSYLATTLKHVGKGWFTEILSALDLRPEVLNSRVYWIMD